MKHIILFSITAYQLFFPFRGHCRFYPTCSEYAKVVIRKYGVVKGGWLTVSRLMNCQPFFEVRSKQSLRPVGLKKLEVRS